MLETILAPFVLAFQLALFLALVAVGAWLWFRRYHLLATISAMTSSSPAMSAGPRHRNVYEALRAKMRSSGASEDVSLWFFVDLTASNDDHQLHARYAPGKEVRLNPYERVLCALSTALAPFDSDRRIPLYGFGDTVTRDRSVRNMAAKSERDIACTDEIDCRDGPDQLLAAYTATIERITTGGPTSFGPAIRHVVDHSVGQRRFNVMVIVCDGCVTEHCMPDTLAAIRTAAATAPLSIIIIGVGPGPWDTMRAFDSMRDRAFDNVHFIEYERVMSSVPSGYTPDQWLAANALDELPDQYTAMCRLNLLGAIVRPDARPGMFGFLMENQDNTDIHAGPRRSRRLGRT